jgi:hypothetical protein
VAIVIETEVGEIHRLPEELTLDDHEISIETPGVAIPRRHGEWRFDRFKQAQPRRLTASGSIKGIDKAEAERIGADLRAKLAGAGVLKLRRTQDSDQWIFCEPTDMRHNYHRGTFRASLFTLSVTFEALDPWWYMARRGATHEIATSGDQWEVEHPGTYQEQPVMVRIMPLAGTLVNPRLECAETGKCSALHGGDRGRAVAGGGHRATHGESVRGGRYGAVVWRGRRCSQQCLAPDEYWLASTGVPTGARCQHDHLHRRCGKQPPGTHYD